MINYIASLMLVVSEVLAVVEFLSSYQIPVSGIIQAILLFFWRVVYQKSSLCINDVVEKRRLRQLLKQKQIDAILRISELLNEKNKEIEAIVLEEGELRTVPLNDEKHEVELTIQTVAPKVKNPRVA